MRFSLPGLSPAVWAWRAKSTHFVAALGGLPRHTTARHAGRAHSWECRARPDVKKTQCSKHTASTGRAKRDFPGKTGKAGDVAVAVDVLPRCAAARHAAWACSPACSPRPGVGRARPVHAQRAHRVRNWAGGAERLGGVGRGDFLRWVFLGSAARTWSSRVRRKLSDLDPSLWRRVTALRRCGSAVSGRARGESYNRWRHELIT